MKEIRLIETLIFSSMLMILIMNSSTNFIMIKIVNLYSLPIYLCVAKYNLTAQVSMMGQHTTVSVNATKGHSDI